MPEPGVAVSVRDLVKRYAGVEAVRGVSFDVAAGEIFGLLGPNGAGKTTTIECVLGLRHADGGSVTVVGVDALREPVRVKRVVGAQLQSTALQDKITPREALALFGAFYDNAIKPDELITRFSLQEKADAPFDSLSGGQRQRLALALAFVNDPQVVFLDEPTAGLDPQVRRELHREIRQIKAAGRTVVLSTHYIEEAQQLCDRIAIIDRGRVVATGRPDELVAAAKTPARLVVRAAKPLAVERVCQMAAVTEAEDLDAVWHLGTHDVTRAVLELVRLLESDANELLDLQVLRPSLEDVFLELTGNRFDEAAQAHSPSPGTPGEGRGGGVFVLDVER
jgi:ABC-2 type transport system ATP-binding protein